MTSFVVTDTKFELLSQIENAQAIDASYYIGEAGFSEIRSANIFNLCQSHKYQSIGYYVSLLAGARGHRVFPSVDTITDIDNSPIVKILSDELDTLIQKSFAHLITDEYELSLYFGKNVATHYDKLCAKLFTLFPAPLMKARFERRQKKWSLASMKLASPDEIPPNHEKYLIRFASEYFQKKRIYIAKRVPNRYDIAILLNENEAEPPSNRRAIDRFMDAAKELDLGCEVISKDDADRISEFDGLFIRETTSVNHYTFQIARAAEAEGLAVIDDPSSIIKCTNKVYLAEILGGHGLPIPKTHILSRKDFREKAASIIFPSVIKQPDSAFSQGVHKASSRDELLKLATELFEQTELIVVQEFVPTEFDWRVGVIAGQPLYACKYFMAKKHWQVRNKNASERSQYGKVETVSIEDTPKKVVDAAVRASKLMGNGLYGVDLKQFDDKVVVIEVNDNPNIDAGYEDKILKDDLYLAVMNTFLRKIDFLKGNGAVARK